MSALEAIARDARVGIGTLYRLDAGAVAGSLRDDVPAEDVVAGLAGVLLACQQPDQRQQVERLLDLLVDGLRPHAENKPRATRAPT